MEQMINWQGDCYTKEEAEKIGEQMVEYIEFIKDLHTELVFIDGIAKLKNYYGKIVEVREDSEHEELFDIYLDGKNCGVTVCLGNIKKEYSAYDGVDGYGWYNTIKEAVKSYMDWEYRKGIMSEYDNECSNCRGGGCLYCETHRFL